MFDSLDATEKKKRDRKRIKKKKPKEPAAAATAAPAAARPVKSAAASAPVPAPARPAAAPAAAAPARAQAPPPAAAAAVAPAPARASASSAIGKLVTVTRNYLDGAVTVTLLPQILQSVAKYLNQNMSQARAFLESDVMLNVVTILVHLAEGSLDLDAQQTRDSLKLGDAIVSILLPDADVELHMHLQRNLRDVLSAVGKLTDVPVCTSSAFAVCHSLRSEWFFSVARAHAFTVRARTHARAPLARSCCSLCGARAHAAVFVCSCLVRRVRLLCAFVVCFPGVRSSPPPPPRSFPPRRSLFQPTQKYTDAGAAVRAVHRRLLPRSAAPGPGQVRVIVCHFFFRSSRGH
jgi:hypothetical protein